MPGVCRAFLSRVRAACVLPEPSALDHPAGKEHTALVHYLLFYEVAEDYVSRRAQFREAHLEKAWKASEGGELVLGGALAHPVDGAVLLFQGDTPEIAERFAREDPYVTSGAVKRWYVREWTTVVGKDAAVPVKPGGQGSR